MNKKSYKVLIAHSAQQHSFRTAVALKKFGHLFKYVTSVYDKKGSFTSFLKKFLKGDDLTRANTRKTNELEGKDIIQFCELSSLMLLLLYRIDKKKIFYNKWNDFLVKRFNRRVAFYAIRHNVDAVIMYDTLASKAFQILEKRAPHIKRVIDMSAPNFNYMDMLFRKDLEKKKDYSFSLSKEMSSSPYKKVLKQSKLELDLSHYFLVASKFTEGSLRYNGIEPNRIHMSRYGIDSNIFIPPEKERNISGKLKCVFIGTVTQKKGAFHLLESIKNSNLNKFHFKFIGTFDSESDYYKDFKDICEFTGHVTKDKVVEYCQDANILIFPSLADGFGLSALEGMSCGLPVICSANAGVSDLIVNGYNGFVIEAGNAREITKKLEWFDENRDRLKEMSENARKTALKCTWDAYEKNIQLAVQKIKATSSV